MITQEKNDIKLNKFAYLAMILSMIGLSVLWIWGLDGGDRTQIMNLFAGTARPHFWSFASSIVFIEWIAFLVIYYTLKKNNEPWKSIGVNWNWFYKNRLWIFLVLIIPVLGAIFMPGFYNYTAPNDPQFIDIGPASTIERLVFILAAATAGICEEVIYRGFALTRLAKLFKNNWIAVVVTALFHVFLHGVPDSLEKFTSYFVVGIIFGGAFVLMKKRRLEILILAHFLIDALYGAFIP